MKLFASACRRRTPCSADRSAPRHRRRAPWAGALLALLLPGLATAETIVLPLAEVRDLVAGPYATPTDAVRAILARELRARLAQAGFDPASGMFVTEIPVEPQRKELADFCPIPLPKSVDTDATTARLVLDDSSRFSLALEELQSIHVTASLSGNVRARARSRVQWGQAIPFVSGCARIGTDRGWISVYQPFRIELQFDLELDLTYDARQVALIIDKQASIQGGLTLGSGRIDPEFGDVSVTEILVDAFEDYLLDKLDDAAQRHFAQERTTLNYRLDGRDAAGKLDPAIQAFNGPTLFLLEQDGEDRAHLRAILAELGLPDLVIELVQEHGAEILLELVAMRPAEREAYLTELGALLACDAILARYQAPLPRVPLYRLDGALCGTAELDGPAQPPYFSDAHCTQQVGFRPGDQQAFCEDRFGARAQRRLGNGASWPPDPDQPNDPLPGTASRLWTLEPSTALDIGLLSIADKHQPYMKRLRYKIAAVPERPGGVCKLEMRVYKQDIGATGLKPLLALHGGTWKSRGFSFLGLETTAAQFTERGFIVFAPFYRLVGDSEGNVQCNGATWRQVIEDVEDALSWVHGHGPALGARAVPVALFGQSAGAHLAAWLASYRPLEVDRALLMYPPLDALDFLHGALPALGEYQAFRDFGLRALTGLFGARAGPAELRLTALDPDRLQPSLLLGDPEFSIADGVFDLSTIDRQDPPGYLRRCAAAIGLDLAATELADPPHELLSCLKQELAEFLLANSFFEPLGRDGAPLRILQGAADTLVPYQQAIRLCGLRAGWSQPEDISRIRTSYACGAGSEASIIRHAEHALDLGICVGPLCPAGRPGLPRRAAAATALAEAYAWLAGQ